MSKVTAPWQEGEIENSHAAGHCPTVCSCRRYHTKGTQAGDWYLPTIGELGIMWARMKEINDSLDLIGEDYAIKVGSYEEMEENSELDLVYGNLFWSCLETKEQFVKTLIPFQSGRLSWPAKFHDNAATRARAFLAIE